MELTIKRRHIIDALRYNHLVAGAWFEGGIFDDVDDKIVKPNCTACLVGSSARRAYKPKTVKDYQKLQGFIDVVTRTGTGISGNYNINNNLQKGHFLNAISCLFESTIQSKAEKKYPDKEISDKQWRNLKLTKLETQSMIDWVKKNIPVEFMVSDI